MYVYVYTSPLFINCISSWMKSAMSKWRSMNATALRGIDCLLYEYFKADAAFYMQKQMFVTQISILSLTFDSVYNL